MAYLLVAVITCVLASFFAVWAFTKNYDEVESEMDEPDLRSWLDGDEHHFI